MNDVRGFSLNNYKSFLKETGGVQIECRPLTLFYGRNHAGKSALIRALGFLVHSLRQAQSQRSASGELLHFDFTALSESTFDDIKSHGSGETIEFSLDCNVNSSAEPVRLKWIIRRLNGTSRLVVDTFEARCSAESLTAEYRPNDQGEDAYQMKKDSGEPTEVPGTVFEQLLPTLSPDPKTDQWRDRLAAIRVPNVQWLSPSRAHVERAFALVASPTTIGPDGSGFEQILAREADSSTSRPLLNSLSAWLRAHLGLSLEVRPNGSMRELICRPVKDEGNPVNIVDAGQGVQELLPLLTFLFQKKAGPTISLIEEPESHLHPDLHASLGELFAQHVKQHPTQMLMVETHSANLLLSLRLQIAQGILPPESLVVYWLRWSHEGFSQADKLTFDAMGRPIGTWPSGVFSEDVEQARRLRYLQKLKTEDHAL